VKFRVHRPNWLRGQGDGSLLRNGARCCLGFLAKAAGFSDDDMRNFSELTELIDHLDHLGSPHIDGLACVEQVVIDVNDGRHITDRKREAKLTRLFKSIGIDVEFTDEPEPAQ
jgi:hypothetical protein